MVACDICGKGVMYGHNVRHTHSGQWMKRASKTRRIFLPNLHKGHVLVNGKVLSVRACASCLAKFKAPRELLVRKFSQPVAATA